MLLNVLFLLFLNTINKTIEKGNINVHVHQLDGSAVELDLSDGSGEYQHDGDVGEDMDKMAHHSDGSGGYELEGHSEGSEGYYLDGDGQDETMGEQDNMS